MQISNWGTFIESTCRFTSRADANNETNGITLSTLISDQIFFLRFEHLFIIVLTRFIILTINICKTWDVPGKKEGFTNKANRISRRQRLEHCSRSKGFIIHHSLIANKFYRILRQSLEPSNFTIIVLQTQ